MINVVRMNFPGDDLFSDMMYIFGDIFMNHSCTNNISTKIP